MKIRLLDDIPTRRSLLNQGAILDVRNIMRRDDRIESVRGIIAKDDNGEEVFIRADEYCVEEGNYD